MSAINETAPARGAASSSSLAGIHSGQQEQDNNKPTGQKRSSQQERVLAILLAADEVCGSELYRAYLPRFGSSIHRLRKAGHVISKRPCDRSEHDHEGTAYLYCLEAVPYDPKGEWDDA